MFQTGVWGTDIHKTSLRPETSVFAKLVAASIWLLSGSTVFASPPARVAKS
jgi:hypothetical protein